MSAVLIVKLPDADPNEASRFAAATLKAMLAPLGLVEVFTFEEAAFTAHWKPLAEPLMLARSQVHEAEHQASWKHRQSRRA